MADDLYQAAGIGPQPDLYQAAPGAYSAAVKQGPENQTNWVDDALHDATGGLIDKVDAAAQAIGVPGLPATVPGLDFSDRYHKNLANIRAGYGDYEAVNPNAAKAAKAAGVVGPMLATMGAGGAAESLAAAAERPAMSTTARVLASPTVKSGATGATVGGAFGFGSTDDSSLSQDLAATGLGAAAGGTAGLALPLAAGIASAPFRIAGRAAKVFTQPGIDQAAGTILNRAATAPGGSAITQPPLSGMKLTLGQTTNDPGLLWLERSVQQGSPQGASLASQSTAANNGAVHGAIGQLGDQTADPAKGMSDALDAAYTKRKAANSAIWKQADVSNTGGVSGFQFNNYMNKYIAGLPIADKAAIPSDIGTIMQQMADAKTQNLSDVQSVRSMIGGRAAMASRSGDGNTARILGGLGDQIESFIDMKAQNLGEKFPLYNAARADTKDMKQTYATHPAVRAALGTDSFGADKVPVSATADHFIQPATKKGAPETFQSYLNAIGTKGSDGKVTYDPAGLKAAQDAFAQKFLGSVTNSGVDANGLSLVSPAKTGSFVDNYSHVINSPLFTQSQRDLIGAVSDATKVAGRTAGARPPGGGSDTFPKLQGSKFLDVLVGPGAQKLVNGVGTLGGAAAGYLLHGGPEAVLGALGGGKVADMVSGLYAAPQAKAVSLITEAMHDPQLASALMQKASNANAKLMPAARSAKIMGILGAQAAQPAVRALTAQ